MHAVLLNGQSEVVTTTQYIRSRYIELVKDKTDGSSGGNWKDKEKEKEKDNGRSPVLMMLSDGCIEDMASMLFTTVVANLSVIVGHDIDGQPLPLPSSTLIQPTMMQRLQRILDPCDFLRRGGHYQSLSSSPPSSLYAISFDLENLSLFCCNTSHSIIYDFIPTSHPFCLAAF